MSEKRQEIYRTIMIVLVTAFITFIVTTLAMDSRISKALSMELGSDNASYSNLEKYLTQVKGILNEYYLWKDDINEEKMQEGAVKGYIEAIGDKYTEYIPKEEMEEYTQEILGSFEGIGVYMIADEESNRIIIYYPIPESPAQKAGIKAGDKIISVDGVEYTAKDFSTISEKIKGEVGTQVTLVVEREGEQLSFSVTRAKVETNPITAKVVKDNIGLITMPSFDEDSATVFKEKVEQLQNQGITSLIIDLRNDGGGIVNVATEIADYILDKDQVIIKTLNNKQKEEVKISPNEPWINMPIVILVNNNTASSAEILTAALKDNNKATVVGTKTFGKGIIQSVLTLNDGSGLKITTESYYRPNGEEIHNIGITPDEVVELPKDIDSIYGVKEEQDTQLQKAIEILDKKE